MTAPKRKNLLLNASEFLSFFTSPSHERGTEEPHRNVIGEYILWFSLRKRNSRCTPDGLPWDEYNVLAGPSYYWRDEPGTHDLRWQKDRLIREGVTICLLDTWGHYSNTKREKTPLKDITITLDKDTKVIVAWGLLIDKYREGLEKVGCIPRAYHFNGGTIKQGRIAFEALSGSLYTTIFRKGRM